MIVISGGTGRLGTALRKVLPEGHFPIRDELDVCDQASVSRFFVQRNSPSVFIHAAAMTDVRLAEINQKECWETNVLGTQRLVDALKLVAPECYFVYISTACVFHGDRSDYTENDIPNPKNFYGLSKLVGEYVARSMPSHLVLRTNFVAFEPWRFPRAFVDRFGTYLFADDVAEVIKQLVAARQQGVVHVAGDKRLSMYELARLTTTDVGTLTMQDVNLPLTIDMTLRSIRIPAFKIGNGRPLP